MSHTMSLYHKPLFKENMVLFKRSFASVDEMIEPTAAYIGKESGLDETTPAVRDLAKQLFDPNVIGSLAIDPSLNIRSCFIFRDGDIGHFTIEFMDGSQLRGYPSIEQATL